MSAAILDDRQQQRPHWQSWATSLALHGLLGGVIVWFAVSTQSPVIETPFQWDVALVSASVPATEMPPATPAVAAAKSSPPAVPALRRAPMPVPAAKLPLLPAPEVNNAEASAEPVTQSPVPMASVLPPQEQGMRNSEEVPPIPAMDSVTPTVANAPASAINTGELAEHLWRRMEALKRYPYLARRNGWEGKVFIKVVLDGDGRLLHAEIQESSGHEVLDQDALQVLRAAAALKVGSNSSVAQGCASAASAGCAGAAWQQQATFTLPVAYRLQR